MRHLRSYSIVSFLFLILIGQTCGVLGQTIQIANHVVINEADTNPYGDDTKYPIDWVELYNPTNSPVNIGGWTVGATSGLHQTYTISANTVIQSKQFLVFTYGPLWFPHAGAVIQLKSSDGTVVDQTPPLTDFQGDSNSWQRIYDGYDTGSASDWVFKLGTPGSSNGKPPTTTTISPTTMTLVIDKPSYIFGDTVMMSGKVSKLVFDPVLGYPLSVNIAVTGPAGFQKTFTLYPSVNLQFSTSMKTDKVMGFNEGNYTISASYGSATASAIFVLSSTAFIPPPQTAPITMSISTDKPTYTVSNTITLSGIVSQVIPLTPVSYKVYDPNGTMIYQGNLFPDSQGKFSTYNPYQQHASASGVFINTINPLYGIYKIVASYGTVTTTTSFEFIPQAQTAGITLSTDKQAYAPGDTVTISGHASLQGLQNLGLSPSLQIIHTLQTSSSGTIQIGNRGIVPNAITVRTQVNIASDGTFTYQLNLPGTSSSLGNYRAIITTAIGSTKADFVVVTNSSTYKAASSAPLSITTDKTLYAIGDNIVISGQVLNPQSHTTTGGTSVIITVVDSNGNTILSQQAPHANKFAAVSTAAVPLTYFAYPDSNGAFQVTQTIQTIFQPGNYTLKATYSSISTSVPFSVYNPLSTGSQGPITANTDKQLYAPGETVHLTGKISYLTGASSSYTVKLLKPTGELVSNTLAVNNGLFSWDWTIPTSAPVTSSSISGGYRGSVVSASITQNLYGIYSIIIHSDFGNAQLFFQVLQNPQSQSQILPIAVQTDKKDYKTTEVVNISGQVLPQTNAAAQEQNTLAQIFIYSGTGQEAYRIFPNVNVAGQFHLSVPLKPVIWKTGTYRIYAQYLTASTQTTFNVKDLFVTSNSTKLQVFITTDRDKYLPGQTVLVTGRTSFIIGLEKGPDLTFGLANDTIIYEGQVVSPHGHTLQTATTRFDQYGSFSYDYTIPKTTPPGNYTVISQVPFGVFNAYYQVVNQLPPENIVTQGNATSQGNATQVIPPPSNATQIPTEPTIVPTSIGPTEKAVTSATIIDKQGMLMDSNIPITIGKKTVGNSTSYPRELDGLLRVNLNDVNAVTVKLSLQDGTCIIGPDPTCKISQSTVQGGSLYQIVKLGNENFLVGFSGSGKRLQQFSIIPANANDVIPDGQWNVNIIKNDQVSRFYSQITYLSK